MKIYHEYIVLSNKLSTLLEIILGFSDYFCNFFFTLCGPNATPSVIILLFFSVVDDSWKNCQESNF